VRITHGVPQLRITKQVNFSWEGRIVPRKGHVPRREILPDPLYKNKTVTKLINIIMLDGKRGVAQKIVYGAFNKINEKNRKRSCRCF
jgi:small subunit ribosomal protein S7